MPSSFSTIRTSAKSTFAKLIPHPTPHTATMQENTSPEYRNTYLSQSFDASTTYPESFDEFKESRIGQVPIVDIPSRIKEKHQKIWGEVFNMDLLTSPLADSIKVAETLYFLRPYVNTAPEGLQEKADMHHAFVRLTNLWKKFEEALQTWARTEVGEDADAADGLSRLEDARFMPVLARFILIFEGYRQPDLFEEVEEFVTTSITLSERIEFWLHTQGTWLL